MNPLEGCYAKLRQADAHADALDREIRAFTERKAYRIAHKPDPQTGDYVFYVEEMEEPPLLARDASVHGALARVRGELAFVGYSQVAAALLTPNADDLAAMCPSGTGCWSKSSYRSCAWSSTDEFPPFALDADP